MHINLITTLHVAHFTFWAVSQAKSCILEILHASRVRELLASGTMRDAGTALGNRVRAVVNITHMSNALGGSSDHITGGGGRQGWRARR